MRALASSKHKMRKRRPDSGEWCMATVCSYIENKKEKQRKLKKKTSKKNIDGVCYAGLTPCLSAPPLTLKEGDVEGVFEIIHMVV